MTIRYASAAQDPSTTPLSPLPAENTQGNVKENSSWRSFPVDMTAADTVIFGRVPSNAKICPDSILRYGAVTGITSFDVGLYAELSPWVIDSSLGSAACLIAALDIHLAGTKDVSALVTPSLSAKNAWELAGLASDPGGMMLVVGTVHAAGGTATAAANVSMTTRFRKV